MVVESTAAQGAAVLLASPKLAIVKPRKRCRQGEVQPVEQTVGQTATMVVEGAAVQGAAVLLESPKLAIVEPRQR